MKIDIIAEDAKGRDVLLVEVKASRLNDDEARWYFDYMREAELPVRFGMVADPDRIRVVDYERSDDATFACVLESTDILRVYDPEFGTEWINESYLTALVDAWLRDLTYHWKSESPPGAEELADIGLLACLDNGDTRREVLIGNDPLR